LVGRVCGCYKQAVAAFIEDDDAEVAGKFCRPANLLVGAACQQRPMSIRGAAKAEDNGVCKSDAETAPEPTSSAMKLFLLDKALRKSSADFCPSLPATDQAPFRARQCDGRRCSLKNVDGGHNPMRIYVGSNVSASSSIASSK
jgi:hypothetical protein